MASSRRVLGLRLGEGYWHFGLEDECLRMLVDR